MRNPSPWVGSVQELFYLDVLHEAGVSSSYQFRLNNIIGNLPTPLRSPYSEMDYFLNISRARQSITQRRFAPFRMCIRS